MQDYLSNDDFNTLYHGILSDWFLFSAVLEAAEPEESKWPVLGWAQIHSCSAKQTSSHAHCMNASKWCDAKQYTTVRIISF